VSEGTRVFCLSCLSFFVLAAIIFLFKKKRAKAIGTQATAVSLNMYTCPGSQAKWSIAQGIDTSGRKVVPRMQPRKETNNIDTLRIVWVLLESLTRLSMNAT